MKKNTHKSDCVELHAGFSSSHKFFSLVKSLNQQTSFKSGILFFRMYNSCKFLQHWMSAKVVMQFTLKMDKKRTNVKKSWNFFREKGLVTIFRRPHAKSLLAPEEIKNLGVTRLKLFVTISNSCTAAVFDHQRPQWVFNSKQMWICPTFTQNYCAAGK